MEPAPSINRSFALVAQEAAQRNISSSSSAISPAAFLVRNNSNSSMRNPSQTKKKEKAHCTHCGLQGHTIDRCYKLHGYPPGYKFSGSKNASPSSSTKSYELSKATAVENLNAIQHSSPSPSELLPNFTPEQCQSLMNLLQTHLTKAQTTSDVASSSTTHVAGTCYSVLNSIHSSTRWVLDSGASAHVCFSRPAFTSLVEVSDMSVTLPNNSRIPVKFIGDVRLNSHITLRGVLYIPDFQFNLLFISALATHMSVMIQFVGDSCLIQDKSSLQTIGRGEYWHGLYLIDAEYTDRIAATTHVSSSMSSAQLWHARLSHPSPKHLDVLKDILHCTFDKHSSIDPCLICPLAKQKRLSFQNNNHLSARVFDLIHCDIWGPYQSYTHAGQRFFLTIVDDYSRFTWVFMMRHKYDALILIPKFFKYVETQFNKHIKQFRSDNAPELSFADFFISKGVIHQFSCVGRPEQNFVVERKH